MISKKLLETLVAKHGANAEALHADIEKYNNIKQSLKYIKNQQQKEQEKLKQKIRSLNSKIIAIQNTCDHPDTTYYPDPSGNNDSHTSCNICGKER